ncbi:MAG TPA: 2-amino-4-hydroxy-6-hydroxymethyldihydropteridine diphosphokinase, partial [Saprospiraceae bacterium]|nr:2-amino-4-hydroxy-6-hydroxymethyldihydropteridine diphosphokinase [Saprospiraceae bacterium]
SVSSIYETEPWGNKAQGFFLNQVIRVRTDLHPERLITILLGIEHRMGRKRTIKNAPRVIDLDILFFMDQIIEQDHLTIPHEKIADRRFILAPMAELDYEFRHPVLHQTMIQLLERCSDPSSVIKIQRHEKTS